MTDLLNYWNSKTAQEVGASTLQPSIQSAILLHLEKPWVPGFKAVVISPLKPKLESYLTNAVYKAGRLVWYYPSMKWWLAHANASHHPLGTGCDVDVHVAYLTPRGKNAEFAYANVDQGGNLHILGRKEFQEECQWWSQNV